MAPRWRWTLWTALLLGTAGLVLFESRGPQVGAIVDVVAPRAGSDRSSGEVPAETRGGSTDAMILTIRPRPAPSEVEDAFPVRDWNPPPPPPPPKPAAPPPPTAPPFPYTVFGKKLEDGVWQVFLRRDEHILVAKTLDTIDNQYRVDEIRPPVMTLTYLPLQQRQTIPIGGSE